MTVHGPRLASAVMFVTDLDASIHFYSELLRLELTLQTTTAALLVSPDGFQLYLRSMGPHAHHALGGIGVQYVIWTAVDDKDLSRCEHVLRTAGAHIHTDTHGGFTWVEGRDPNHVPVVITFPGPDQMARDDIRTRIYEW
jgi:catechol 2,3-dioxygenase-like lactoylglutathione lyase family enzyme